MANRLTLPNKQDKFPLHGTGNGKCGYKLLLNCLPAQPVPVFREMYVKISNVSTFKACNDEIETNPNLL